MLSKLTPPILLCSLAFGLNAQTMITDNDLLGGQTYNWTKDQTYVVNGLVYLEAGGRLNIEAGTVVKFRADPDGVADADNTSALIITKGAQIFAEGTANAPIIFTAEADNVTDPRDLEDPTTQRGLWGGLIILGNGTVARPNSVGQIEGISANEARGNYGGGATPNDTESSGKLRYVSIRHGGNALSGDNEINGLTLGAVGSGTEIDYVEVFANVDDGIELFGGTVDIKHAAVAFSGDDSYDYDLGWRGRGQFWFSLNGADISGRAGEHDGADPDGQLPFANPTIANATYIGSGVSATGVGNDGNDYAIVLRDGGAMKYFNSVFTDFPSRLLDLEDLPAASGVDSYQRLLDGDVEFKGNVIGAFGRAGSGGLDSLIRRYSGGNQPSGNAVITLITTGNRFVGNSRILTSIGRGTNGQLDPRPFRGSPANDGAPLAQVTNTSTGSANFFETTTYAGAFANETGTWLDRWTALSFYGVTVAPGTVGTQEVIANNSVSLFPNPTQTGATLSYEVAEGAAVEIAIYDVNGRLVAQTAAASSSAGLQQAYINTQGFTAGLYLVRLTAGEQVVTQRLTVSNF